MRSPDVDTLDVSEKELVDFLQEQLAEKNETRLPCPSCHNTESPQVASSIHLMPKPDHTRGHPRPLLLQVAKGHRRQRWSDFQGTAAPL